MKNKIIIVAIYTLLTIMSAKAQNQKFSARVISASDSIPVEFATVKLMQPDSVMVKAVLTDENGVFNFDSPVNRGMYLSISSVGCKNLDVSLPCDSLIYLENSNELTEVVVHGNKKFVKGTSRGLQISMDGNPLAKIGNAMESIKQFPMIDSTNGGISVLGLGTPVIYINNRLVRSFTELSTLSADDSKRPKLREAI